MLPVGGSQCYRDVKKKAWAFQLTVQFLLGLVVDQNLSPGYDGVSVLDVYF